MRVLEVEWSRALNLVCEVALIMEPHTSLSSIKLVRVGILTESYKIHEYMLIYHTFQEN